MKTKTLRNVMLTVLSMVLVAAISIGGSLAFFTDTEKATNTFTAGNVDIQINEQQRNANGNALEAFKNGKLLTPIVGSAQDEKDNWGMPKAKNFVDKIVSIKNIGENDAWVRVFVAVPAALVDTNKDGNNDTSDDALHVSLGNRVDSKGENRYSDPTYDWKTHWIWNYGTHTVQDNVYIDGERYYVECYTWEETLAAGEETLPIICGVYLDSKVDWDDETEKYTFDGKELDYDLSSDEIPVKIFAQAVQKEGFENYDDAFNKAGLNYQDDGKPLPKNPWDTAITYTNSLEGLKEAITNGADTVVLTENVTLDEQLEVKGDLTIIGDSTTTLTAPEGGTRVVNVKDNQEPVNLLLSGVTLDATNNERGISFYNNVGALNVTIENSNIKARHYGVNVASNNENATLVINDSELTGFCAFQTWSANTNATFNNCTLTGINQWEEASGAFATIVVNTGADNSVLTFNNCKIVAIAKSTAKEYHVIDSAEGTVINWNNCTFVSVDSTEKTTETDYPIKSGVSYIEETVDATVKVDEVVLVDDVKIESSNKVTLNDGGTFDGNGQTVTKTGEVNEGTNAVVESTGGTIKNLTVVNESSGSKGLRAVYITGTLTSDVIVENCVLDGTYAINVNGKSDQYKLIVKDSVLNGWTSFGKIVGAEFTNVEFGKGSTGYAYLRPYCNTTITNCKFINGFTLNTTEKDITITLTDCYVGSKLITSENIVDLLNLDASTAECVKVENTVK